MMNSISKFQQMFGYIIREYCEERESNIYRFRSCDNCRQKVEERKNISQIWKSTIQISQWFTYGEMKK